MSRSLRITLLTLTIGGGATLAARALAAGQPCAIATHGDSPVAQACADGGLIAAKRTMRELIKRAKNAGTKFECDDCHKSDVGYELTAQARDNFRKLLTAAGH